MKGDFSLWVLVWFPVLAFMACVFFGLLCLVGYWIRDRLQGRKTRFWEGSL
jgi:hypothetical protein